MAWFLNREFFCFCFSSLASLLSFLSFLRFVVMLIDQTNLDFVNSLSAFLKIQLSEPSTPIGNTWNEKAPPTATIVSLKFAYISRYVDEVGDLVELTEEELSRFFFFFFFLLFLLFFPSSLPFFPSWCFLPPILSELFFEKHQFSILLVEQSIVPTTMGNGPSKRCLRG